MGEAFLRRLSRWQAEQQRAPLAEVHVRAYDGTGDGGGDPHGGGRDGRERFLRRFERHVQVAGFDMAVADADGGPVGWAYGFRAEPDGASWMNTAWGGGLSAPLVELPADVVEFTNARRAFVLVEFVVLPTHRRRGIATRMNGLLLSRLTNDLVVTAVPRPSTGDGRTDAAAETLHAWGWEKLGEAVEAVEAVEATGSSAGGDAGARELWVRRPHR